MIFKLMRLVVDLPPTRVRASLPNTIVAMLEQVYREAGLIGTVLFAGPDVEQGGNICSLV
jgi:hypothetical protein